TRHESSKIIFEDHLEVGYNYRLTDIQASVGLQQLEKLDWIIAKRKKIASRYHKAFKAIKCIQLPKEQKGYSSNYQSYSIYLKDDCPVSRNDFMQKMLDAGISTRRGIMTTHRETAYKEEYAGLSLPVSEKASDRSIILPLYIPMKEEDIQKVIDTFISILK
ncbi:MAG: DegT/DnrJ/EryC1/StrS family aminotransferase, partial [Bacteroidota bacterium]|nr:DegT/DnrJ/EryC1/StrS family aminotransferase [Bacteroidota bacterium]